MSVADEIIAKDMSLDSLIIELEKKMLEPKWRDRLATNEHASTMALVYLMAKAIRKELRTNP